MTLHDVTQAEIAMVGESVSSSRHHPRLEIDVRQYQELLDNENFDPEQRDKFLGALWTVIVAFIDLGYRVHPVQRVVPDFSLGEDFEGEIHRSVREFFCEAA